MSSDHLARGGGKKGVDGGWGTDNTEKNGRKIMEI